MPSPPRRPRHRPRPNWARPTSTAARLLEVPGEAPRRAQTVIVIDGVIDQVIPGFADAPEGATTVDLRDRFVMPGLIDCHTHITGSTARTCGSAG
jgi:imidazolonepropionase-like amidohydrolase